MGRYGRRRPPCGVCSRGHSSRPETSSKKRVVTAFHCIADAVTHMQGALFNMQVNMERTAYAVNCVAHALGEQVPIVDGIEQRMCMLESTLANRYPPVAPSRHLPPPRCRPSFGRRVDGICSDPVAAHYHFRSGRLKPCPGARRESRRECRRECRRENRQESRRPCNTPNFPRAHTPCGWKGADTFVSSDPGITIRSGIKNRLSPGPPKTSCKMHPQIPPNQFAPGPRVYVESSGSNWNPSPDNTMNNQNWEQFESYEAVEPFRASRPSYNPSVWSARPSLLERSYSATHKPYSSQMSTESKSLQSTSYNQVVTDDYQAADETSYSSHKILSDSTSRDHGMSETIPAQNDDSSYSSSSSRRGTQNGRSQFSEQPSSTIAKHLSSNNRSRSEQKSFFEDDWSNSQSLNRGFRTNENYSPSQLQMRESPIKFALGVKTSPRPDFSTTSPLSFQGKVSSTTSSNAPSASRGKSSSPSGTVVGASSTEEKSRDQPIEATRQSSQSLDRSSSSSRPSSKATSGSKETAPSYSKSRDRSMGQPERRRSNKLGLAPWSTISSPSTKNVETLYPRSTVYSTVLRSLSNKVPSVSNLRGCPSFAPRSTSSSRSSSTCHPPCVRPATVPRADGVPEGPQLRTAPRPAKACQGPSKRLANLGKSLLNAAQDGRLEAVRNLLNEGAEPNFTFGSDWTALHRACAKGHAAVVALLLQRGACPHTRVHSFAPLHMAAYEDLSGRCVAHLLEAGARPNCRNAYGRTPIHYAAQSGNEAAIRALVEVGACKSPRDSDGRTPLDLAKTHCIRRLLKPYCSKKRTSQ